jgi:hypothetical protein
LAKKVRKTKKARKGRAAKLRPAVQAMSETSLTEVDFATAKSALADLIANLADVTPQTTAVVQAQGIVAGAKQLLETAQSLGEPVLVEGQAVPMLSFF